MAAVTNIDYVQNVMIKKKFPYWTVYDDKVKVNQNDEEKNPIHSAKELAECIENLEGGFVEVTISSKTGKDLSEGGDIKNTVLKYTVKCGASTSKKNSEPQSNKELIALITQNVELKFQNKIEQLEAKIKEYEEEEEEGVNGIELSPTDKIIEMLLPHAPAVIGKLFNIEIAPVKPATILNGTEDSPKETKTTVEGSQYTPEQVVQFKKAAQAGKMLHNIDPFFGDRLLGLAILAKYDLNTYNMASGYLNNMLEALKQQNAEVKAFFDGKQ